ncbi:MAG: hypothetical protein ACK5CY_12105 [Bacteroidia bacterium]
MLKALKLSMILFALGLLMGACKKEPETGFSGSIFFGEGSCTPAFKPVFDRDYAKFNGTVYFIPYSLTQEFPLPDIATLQQQSKAFKVKNGNLVAELEPGIYKLALNNYIPTEAENELHIESNVLLRENLSFWRCNP